jgi:SAM-dependent methyltransferase
MPRPYIESPSKQPSTRLRCTVSAFGSERHQHMSLSSLDRYERIAWVYDLLDLPFEYARYRKIRPLLFRGLSGRILDAGVNTGRNFLSPAMLVRAERRRGSAAAHVELRQMDVTRLGFPDGFFDAAVAAFLFCTLPDELQVAGMRELGRVVKPGGIIRFWNTRVRAGAFAGRSPGCGSHGSTGPMARASTARPKSTFRRRGCSSSSPASFPTSSSSSSPRGCSFGSAEDRSATPSGV